MRVATNRRRRAAVNRTLIVILALVAVTAGGFWAYKLSAKPELPVVAADAPEREYLLICACGYSGNVKESQLNAMPMDGTTGMRQCPRCKQNKAAASRPGSTAISVGGG